MQSTSTPIKSAPQTDMVDRYTSYATNGCQCAAPPFPVYIAPRKGPLYLQPEFHPKEKMDFNTIYDYAESELAIIKKELNNMPKPVEKKDPLSLYFLLITSKFHYFPSVNTRIENHPEYDSFHDQLIDLILSFFPIFHFRTPREDYHIFFTKLQNDVLNPQPMDNIANGFCDKITTKTNPKAALSAINLAIRTTFSPEQHLYVSFMSAIQHSGAMEVWKKIYTDPNNLELTSVIREALLKPIIDKFSRKMYGDPADNSFVNALYRLAIQLESNPKYKSILSGKRKANSKQNH